MSIALSAGQNILELLDERLSPLRVGPSQQLLGFLFAVESLELDVLLRRELFGALACFAPGGVDRVGPCDLSSLIVRSISARASSR